MKQFKLESGKFIELGLELFDCDKVTCFYKGGVAMNDMPVDMFFAIIQVYINTLS